MWLNAEVRSPGPIRPRCAPRVVQRQFFDLLREKLKLAKPLELRRRFTTCDPPTPTFAFAELPGILPSGWGLNFDFDNTMNQLQCFFYRGSDTKINDVKTGKWSFDVSGIGESVLNSFLDERVVPAIGRLRRTAHLERAPPR